MRTTLPGFLLLALSACATPGTPGASAIASSASGATDAASRCASVADSVRAATPLAGLPIAARRGGPRLPIPAKAPSGEIHTTFLVDPSGRAVQSSIVTRGGDHEFQGRMADAIVRSVFRSPRVAGCPSWGRGDIRLRAEIRVR